MSGKIIEMKMVNLEIKKNGAIRGKEDALVINFTLVYPRPGEPGISTIKQLTPQAPFSIDYTQASYAQSVIFKELIVGDSQLVIDVLAVDNPSKFESFLTGIFKGVLTVATGNVVGGISNVFMGAAAGSAGDAFLGQIKTDKSTQRIGHVVVDLKSDDLQNALQIDKELTVPQDIIHSEKVYNDDGSGSDDKETVLLAKGDVNGRIKFAVHPLS